MLRDYGTLLDDLRGVTWPARRAAQFGTAGTHRSRLRGLSAEFTEYRPYRQGDDPRRLDWKLLARTDRAFLRVTSDRATLGTLLLVDASPSMAFPDPGLGKWRQACRIAVGLAGVAHGSGDPVGLAVFGARFAVRVEARTRRGIVAEIARGLEAADVSRAPRTAHRAPASYRAPLLAIAPAPRIAIISDFLDESEDLLGAARTAAVTGTEVYAIHVVAREEIDPDPRPILAVDPETPERRRPLVAETRDGYLRAFGQWRRGLARAWREAGAVFAQVDTDEPAPHAVRRIVRPAAAATVQ